MIYFDVDDTLYDVSGPFKEAFHETFPERSDIPDDKLFITFRRHCDELFFEHEKKLITRDQMYVLRTARTFADRGIAMSDEQAMAFQRLYQRKQLEIRLPEEMEEILDMLAKKGIRTGVISNGPKEHQWDKVRSLSLLRWMDEKDVIISGEVGVAKPDPKIFRIAQERSGLSADHLWFVGDSFGNDIVPAVKSGWHCIWFDHRHREKDSGISPDETVCSLQELYAVLDSLI